MAFVVVVSTSLWLYNLIGLKQDISNEIDYILRSQKDCMEPNSGFVCVEHFPDYTSLFFSVVSEGSLSTFSIN